MISYSRNFLLSRCLWWKTSSSYIQSSRHCSASAHHVSGFPLDSSTWCSLKSFGLLRGLRGKRAGQFSSKNVKVWPVKPHISCPRLDRLNIQDCFAGSAWMTTNRTQGKKRRNRVVNMNNLSTPLCIPFIPQVGKSSKLCLFNARSICNKAFMINDFVVENDIEMLCLTETWLKSNDQLVINELTPRGYIFEHNDRKGRGGGVGFSLKKSLRLRKISFKTFKSFEAMGMVARSSPANISIFVIYKPPPSNRNNFTNNMFFEEFSIFLEQFSTISDSFLLVGDFNFHVEDNSNAAAPQFLNILECFNLTQHVKQPTYQDRHILDLVITRIDDNIIQHVSVFDPAMSDHFAVFCNLFIKKPPFEKVISRCRKLRAIDLVSFTDDVANSTLVTSPSNDVADLLCQYDTVLTSVLDFRAPSKERIVTLRPSQPWYTAEIKAEKIKRRRLG